MWAAATADRAGRRSGRVGQTGTVTQHAAPLAGERAAPLRIAVLLGAPRSGTTWLQRLMAAHPGVASGQETDLLDDYAGLWVDLWERQLPADPEQWASRRHKGLPAVLTSEEFRDVLGAAVRAVYARTAALKPGAGLVLDKNPGYARRTAMIAALLPDARILHVVRDGRDVAASLVRAGAGWGRGWAPSRVDRAAVRWRERVQAVGAAGLGPDRLLTVRYEDLLANGPAVLHRCLDFAGAATDREECERIYRSLQEPGSAAGDPLLWSGEVVRRLGGPPPEPPGFAGEGRSGSWRSWSAADRWGFDREAGALLVQLGYEPDRSWARVPAGQRLLLTARRGARGRLGTVRRAAAGALVRRP